MRRYKAYVLRIWQGQGRQGTQWSGRLDSLDDQQRWQFNDPEALLAHLRTLVVDPEQPPHDPLSDHKPDLEDATEREHAKIAPELEQGQLEQQV